MKYIHINSILNYIRNVEGEEFQIVKSEDYGIKGVTSFKVIIPKRIKVKSVKLNEDLENSVIYSVQIIDENGNNVMDGPNVLLWNSELYSTKDEKAVCISDDAIENGMLLFENFNNIPFLVDSFEIIRGM